MVHKVNDLKICGCKEFIMLVTDKQFFIFLLEYLRDLLFL